MYLIRKRSFVFQCLCKYLEPCHSAVKNVIFGLTFCFALSAFMRGKKKKTQKIFFQESILLFLLLSVSLFIAFSKCSHWMILVSSGEVSFVFQLRILCWVKRIISDSHLSLQRKYYVTCILSCMSHMKENYLFSDRTQVFLSFFYLTSSWHKFMKKNSLKLNDKYI